jgi:hypothetical protein
MGHSSTRAALIYLNPRVLHQPGEIREVCPGTKGRNEVPRSQHSSFVTWGYARTSPPDARFAPYPGKIIRTDGAAAAQVGACRASACHGANLRVRRPDGLEEHHRGDGPAAAGADQLRAFGRLEYPSAPVHATRERDEAIGAGMGKLLRDARTTARGEAQARNGHAAGSGPPEDRPRPDDHGPDLGRSCGAGEGNRTLMTSLEGWGSTIELRPRSGPGRHA